MIDKPEADSPTLAVSPLNPFPIPHVAQGNPALIIFMESKITFENILQRHVIVRVWHLCWGSGLVKVFYRFPIDI